MANATPLFGAEALGRYDEMLDGSGAVRPQWQRLTAAFAALTPDDYRHHLESAMRMVRENGVTYNVYDEAAGLERPWQLDIAPFVLSADDWAAIEAAVAQRARLADGILRDIYGEQRLLRDGVVPAQLVLGHPQYLRALQGVPPPGGVHVHLYSADLARAANGSWTVLASRADAPAGLGYALENRVVVSQTFPDLFGELRVQRLASYFRHFREAVTGLVREPGGHAVLLTPGPYNEAYFEHAYLARYLGLELVEGDDLSVRDGHVFLRTLGGLARVSVIFRRLDSDFADPLELRADSELGVPGLVEVIRAGNVVVANALGGGVVESPALDAYLPHVSQVLFGEELLVPDIPTVWCGTDWGRAAGLARVNRGIIRNAFDARPLFSRGSSARLGSDLTPAELAAFAGDVERRGATAVVQDSVPLGLAPTFEHGAFASRPMSLRVFAAWTPNGYIVMPGGLARIAADDSVRALSMQSGAASKDVWALTTGPVDTFSLLRPHSQRVEIRRSGNEAPSRAMDNLLWLARYAERTENWIRVLRAILHRLAGDTGFTSAMSAVELAQRLLKPLDLASDEAIEEARAGDDTRLRDEVETVIFGKEPTGLQRLLRRVARTAWAARDRLSPDTWRAIYALTVPDPDYETARSFDGAGARAYLDALIRRSAALSGLADENMTRGNNWLFFDLGRRIERTFSACRLVRHTLTVADERESSAIQVALEIADSAMTYSYRYRNAFQAAPTLDLLLLDPSNPRAVAFQIEAIVRHVADLPMNTEVQKRGRARALAEGLYEAISTTDAYVLSETDAAGKRTALVAMLDSVEDVVTGIAGVVGDAYLQHLRRFPGLMRYAVRHRTTYEYQTDVAYSRLVTHLIPRATARQQALAYAVSVTPDPVNRFERSDFFGNATDWFTIDEPHDVLDILAESRVEEDVAPLPPLEPERSLPWELVRRAFEFAGDPAALEAVQYTFDTPLTATNDEIVAYARVSFQPRRPLLACVRELNSRIHADFKYDKDATDTRTTVERAFELRAGVCQDLAHAGVAAVRAMGLAARYVSGYLLTHPPAGRERLIGADASHAWFAVWIPPFGWVDFDPTNDMLPSSEHITAAWGRDYGDVAPIHGIISGGGEHEVDVAVDVMPLG